MFSKFVQSTQQLQTQKHEKSTLGNSLKDIKHKRISTLSTLDHSRGCIINFESFVKL